jgi:hypothetical protein
MTLTDSQKEAQKRWREKNKEYIRLKNKQGFKRWYEKNRDKHNRRSLLLYHARKQHPDAENVILCSGEQGDEGWAMACYDCSNPSVVEGVEGNIEVEGVEEEKWIGEILADYKLDVEEL